MSKPVLLKLDEVLVDEIDRSRGDVPRTVWIVRACERALERRAVGPAVDVTNPGSGPDLSVVAAGGVPTRVAAQLTKMETRVPEAAGGVQFGPTARAPGSLLKKGKAK